MDWNLLMKIVGSELVLLGAAWLAVGGLSPRTTLPARESAPEPAQSR
jgi:alpha-1,2-mannosyltransferase